MKRMVLAVVLAVGLIVSQSAFCGGGGDKGGAGSSGGKDIVVWFANLSAENLQVAEELAAKLSGPDGKVTVQSIPTEQLRTQIKVVMGSGGAPDVFVGWGGGVTQSFIDEGQLYDMTEDVKSWRDEVYPASWDDATFGGKVYMAPYGVHGSMFYYNKTMFAKLGITPPTTYAELQAAAQKLIDNGIIPFALGNLPRWPGAIYHSDLVMRLGGKQAALDALNNTGLGFMDPAYLRANQLILDEVKAGWYPVGVNGIDFVSGGSRTLFYDGRAGMLLSNGNFASNASSEAPEFFANDLAIIPFPTFPDGKGNDAIICGLEGLSITTKCENKPLAMEFIKQWITDPVTVDRRANYAGTMVTWMNVQYEQQMRKDMWELLTGADVVNNYIADMLPADLCNLYWDLTQNLFGGLMTAEEVSTQLQELNDRITPRK